MTDLRDRLLGPEPPPFAVLHRPEATGPDTLDVLIGEVSTPDELAGVELPGSDGGPGHDVLVLVPYQQIAERGFAVTRDDSPLVAMTVTEQERVPAADVLSWLSDVDVRITGGRFEPDDDTYAATVRRVVEEEIGEGRGANFVIRRSYVADITDYGVRSALAFFRALLQRESGAYWTFVVHTGERTLVGASPERHVTLDGGTAVMNPISGTYRYPPSGPALDGVLGFLADTKETDELYMVVDEELKMMSRICDGRVRVIGPYLREMARLAHTEYFIEGRSSRDPRTILRETMFAPTVTGSPLESACRVIRRYEPEGRGYYSGVLALIGRDGAGARTLDSTILIRTADIDRAGRLRIGLGATLVRHSDPRSEVAETRAKAAGLLAALETPARFAEHPTVRAALRARNSRIADFWLADGTAPASPALARPGRRVLVVDAEDTFTAMLDRQLRSFGLQVVIRRFDEPHSFDEHDFVVMGPGPGDPRESGDSKIAHLRSAMDVLLAERRPFLAVCLSHQVLSLRLGLDVRRRAVPNQGVQHEIDFFGAAEQVGFYNTFAAVCGQSKIACDGIGVVEVSRDAATDEVHALRGPFFASMQFHAESVLTRDGVRILAEQMNAALGG